VAVTAGPAVFFRHDASLVGFSWTDGVYPLRTRSGYRVEGAWIIRERNEFIWLLSRDGNDWEAAEQAYYASAERAAVHPDPAQYIAKVEKWFVTPVLPRAPG